MDKQILYNSLDYWKEMLISIGLMKDPDIDFLLEDGKSETVGAAEKHDHSQNYIYEEGNNDLFHYDEIDIGENMYSYESYIIYCLNHGFDIKYISIPTHFVLWNYINEYLDELRWNTGVLKYLQYCINTGINETFISYYASYEMEDLFRVFLLR